MRCLREAKGRLGVVELSDGLGAARRGYTREGRGTRALDPVRRVVLMVFRA